ncbi:MAG: hypothetical protein V1672_02095 [Candidatus Diapherotrites archaeon]
MKSVLRVFSVLVIAFAIVIVLWPVISNKGEDKSKADIEVVGVADAIAEAGVANILTENEKEITQYNSILRAASVPGPLPNPSYLHADVLFQGLF